MFFLSCGARSKKRILLVLLTVVAFFQFFAAFVFAMTWKGAFWISMEIIEVTVIKSFTNRKTIALIIVVATSIVEAAMISSASLLVPFRSLSVLEPSLPPLFPMKKFLDLY